MPRDPRKLRVFTMADELVRDIYAVTRTFPAEEKYGLTAQMRRAAVSIPTNLVEGCARRTTKDYLHFVSIANGSAYELGYLVELASRLEMMAPSQAETLGQTCGQIAAGLTALIESLANADDAPRPRAQSPKPRA